MPPLKQKHMDSEVKNTVVFGEDPESVLSILRRFSTIHSSNSRGPMPSYELDGLRYSCGKQIYVQTNVHSHKKKINIYLKIVFSSVEMHHIFTICSLM